MIRPFAWMLGGIALAILVAVAIMPSDALGAIVPMLGIVVVGVAIVAVAGVKGKRAAAARDEGVRLLSSDDIPTKE